MTPPKPKSKPTVLLLSDAPENLLPIKRQIELLGCQAIIAPAVCEGIIERYYTDGKRDHDLIESRIIREPLSAPFFTMLRDSLYVIHNEDDLRTALSELQPNYVLTSPKLEAVNFDGNAAHIQTIARACSQHARFLAGNEQEWPQLIASAQQQGRSLT